MGMIDRWPDVRPTYFELLTAFAFWVFKREHVDYMVIEVGLGGLLDATNVIGRRGKVSVITPIGLDHTDVLGTTIAEIAAQKAGIVNRDSVVFTPSQVPEAYQVIQTVAAGKGARLVDVRITRDESMAVPLYQQDNFSLAKAVVGYIAERDGLKPLSNEMITRSMTATPPGRFEVYEINGKTVVLDGAHNPQKLMALHEAMGHQYDGPFAWLVGFVAAPEKKIDDCIEVIAKTSDRYVVTQFSVGQDIKGRVSVPATTIAEKLTQKHCEVSVAADPEGAFELLLQSEQDVLVVTGSLYLVAQLRAYAAKLVAAPWSTGE
jgi:dihydrofolate synthase/folylpolyglutamate synthase